MKIFDANIFTKNHLINFFERWIDNINDDIVMNSSFIYDYDINKIIGTISFEEFGEYGLIRYCIFKRDIDFEELFEHIIEKARAKGIRTLVAFLVKPEAIDLFDSVGFQYVNNNNVFIGDRNIKDTDFKDATVLKKNIDERIILWKTK